MGAALLLALAMQVSYLGGGAVDDCDAITVDHAGDVYLACHCTSEDFPKSPARGRGMDAFVVKLNGETREVIWATRIGGEDYDGAFGVEVDEAGNVYTAGFTKSPASELFVAKLSPEGKVLEIEYFGTKGDDYTTASALSKDGTLYAGGAMDGKGFVAAWSGGRPKWVILEDALYITGIATTASGSLWASGYTHDKAYLAKLSAPDLKVLQRTTFGGSGKDAAWGVALTQDGNPIIAGTSNSPDLPARSNAHQPRHGGADDAFLAIFENGAFYATYLGDRHPNAAGMDGNIIAVDADGHIWLAGITGPDGDRANGFIASISADLTSLRYRTEVGAGGRDILEGLAIAPDGAIWATGLTFSEDIDRPGGRADVMLVRLRP